MTIALAPHRKGSRITRDKHRHLSQCLKDTSRAHGRYGFPVLLSASSRCCLSRWVPLVPPSYPGSQMIKYIHSCSLGWPVQGKGVQIMLLCFRHRKRCCLRLEQGGLMQEMGEAIVGIHEAHTECWQLMARRKGRVRPGEESQGNIS